MRSVMWGALAALASISVLTHAARAQNVQAPVPAPGAPPTPSCTSFEEFIHTDCPLTWHGITLYGTFDAGVGWVSHGMPASPYNYEGQSLVNRNGNHPQWLIAPNNLSQSGVGIKGRVEFMQDWFVVFNAATGSTRSPASSPTWEPPTSPTMASPGPAIRSPATARGPVRPSTTNSRAVFRPS